MRSLTSPASRDSRCEPPRFPVAMELPLDINWAGLLLNFPLLTVKETAIELVCSAHQVRNFIDAGKLLAFPINAEDRHQRSDYRIVRKTAASAFTFLPAKDRVAQALQTIRSVNDWLFAPYDPNIGAWQPALRIASRSVLTVDETAAALRCTGQHVRTLYDANHLRALNISAQSSVLSPQHLRVARESLVAFVTIRLARQNNITL